jgi:ABC-type oligopeptide transport system substrate-binding subunit
MHFYMSFAVKKSKMKQVLKKLSIVLFCTGFLFTASCGSSQSDHESLSNPDQTDDPNARNPQAERIEDSMNKLNDADTTNASGTPTDPVGGTQPADTMRR